MPTPYIGMSVGCRAYDSILARYYSAEDAAGRVAQLMEAGMSRKDAVKQTALELDLPKNVVYDAALS